MIRKGEIGTNTKLGALGIRIYQQYCLSIKLALISKLCIYRAPKWTFA